MCGPRPRRWAAARLVASSTSVRRRGRSSSRRAAPSASWRAALCGPKRGSKPAPHRSTVPSPAASGTNESPCRAAPSASARSCARSAGTSPSRAAVSRPAGVLDCPARTAALSPEPGSSTTRTPRRSPRRPHAAVGGHHDDPAGTHGVDRRSDRVIGDRPRQQCSVLADGGLEARLALRRLLDGNDDVPRMVGAEQACRGRGRSPAREPGGPRRAWCAPRAGCVRGARGVRGGWLSGGFAHAGEHRATRGYAARHHVVRWTR